MHEFMDKLKLFMKEVDLIKVYGEMGKKKG